MNMPIEQAQGKLGVTILHTPAELDASNFQDLIARGKEVYQSGGRYLILDMGATTFISRSGLVALHALASLFSGKPSADPDYGWEALKAIDEEHSKGPQPFVKLLSPQPRIDRALQTTGLKEHFEIFTDREAALSSFA